MWKRCKSWALGQSGSEHRRDESRTSEWRVLNANLEWKEVLVRWCDGRSVGLGRPGSGVEARRRQRAEECRQERGRVADEWPRSCRDKVQPAQADRYDQREPAGAGLVLRHRFFSGNGRSNPDHLEWNALWNGDLERGLRGGRENRKRKVALGPQNRPPEFSAGISRKA